MGQYYRPVVLKKNYKTANNPVAATLSPYGFGNGAKLMEHSYINNSFVRAMEFLLATKFKGYRFAWVGDYADTKVTTKHPDGIDFYGAAGSWICADGGMMDNKQYKDLLRSIPVQGDIDSYKYLVNYTKREYCTMPKYNPTKWAINPLPLLTADGNGRGGGDYRVEDERVGSWAYDCIGLTDDNNEIKGFKRISGVFKPDW